METHEWKNRNTSFGSRASSRRIRSGRSTPVSVHNTSAREAEPADDDLPSINERLAYLRPSRELLEYYRKKIAEFDGEHEAMAKKLEQYKATYEEQHKIQWEQRQREEEISELQKALSDMQVFLFQEREHILRLYAENDRLKIRELEDRKKIHTLLQLSGLTEHEVSYFMKEPPNKAVIEQRLPRKLSVTDPAGKHLAAGDSKKVTGSAAGYVTEEQEANRRDNETLRLQVEALQAQLQEQTRLAREQIEALTEDRRVKGEEYETCRQRDTDKIRTLTEKLHKTQDLLYDSTRDYLQLRQDHRDNEKVWMGEKDRLLRDLDACKEKLHLPSTTDVLNVTTEALDGPLRRSEEVEALTYELQQSQKMADMYREQVIQLEDELARIREQGEVGKDMLKDRCDKLTKRLEVITQRYHELEKRRNLEVEGFKADIKNLRTKLKDLEKQLYKVTMEMAADLEDRQLPAVSTTDDIDLQILRNVRQTAGRSQKLMGELKSLKGKVYGIENDLRHL